MPDLVQLRRRCVRVCRLLDAGISDQVSLLRAARELKTVHASLRAALLSRARLYGWTPAAAEADGALERMETALRTALLEYLSLPRTRLQDQLRQALAGAFEAIDALDSSERPMSP